jgi:hypothetical protein
MTAVATLVETKLLLGFLFKGATLPSALGWCLLDWLIELLHKFVSL